VSVTLGRFGAWLHPSLGDDAVASFAAEAEQLGYGTAWIGGGLADLGDLALISAVLAATNRITVATGIVNMWTNDPDTVAAGYQRIEGEHPGRFLLGVGVGHREAVSAYRGPLAKTNDYLDALDAGGVPTDRRILAALGPRSLAVAGERTAGTHPYLVTPEHSRVARRALGQGKIVAPEQTVVVSTDPASARELGREFANNPYLKLVNYVGNLRRLGYSEADVSEGGSDRLIDDLVPHGSAEQVMARLNEHFDAGADHVAVQSLGTNPMEGLRALAAAGLPS
jgi:probable F420-dependent oxidoreductase